MNLKFTVTYYMHILILDPFKGMFTFYVPQRKRHLPFFKKRRKRVAWKSIIYFENKLNWFNLKF